MSSPMGYSGFENPEEQYYGTGPSIPVLYTGGYQTRQFGVGAVSTVGRPIDISSALASPPSNMTNAATNSVTHAAALYAVTAGDIFNYHHP